MLAAPRASLHFRLIQMLIPYAFLDYGELRTGTSSAGGHGKYPALRMTIACFFRLDFSYDAMYAIDKTPVLYLCFFLSLWRSSFVFSGSDFIFTELLGKKGLCPASAL